MRPAGCSNRLSSPYRRGPDRICTPWSFPSTSITSVGPPPLRLSRPIPIGHGGNDGVLVESGACRGEAWGAYSSSVAPPAEAFGQYGAAGGTVSSLHSRTVLGLKHRGRQDVRPVPIPPELVKILRNHVAEYGSAKDGRIFRSE